MRKGIPCAAGRGRPGGTRRLRPEERGDVLAGEAAGSPQPAARSPQPGEVRGRRAEEPAPAAAGGAGG